MSTEVDINAVCRSWRLGVKKKFRGIADFDERVAERFRVIEQRMFRRRVPLTGWQIRYVDYRDWGDAPVIRDWEPIATGANWGAHGPSAEFRCTVTVPPELDGEEVMLRLYVGGDSLLYVDEVPWHGMDPFRHDLFLFDRAVAGTTVRLRAETYAHYHAPRKDHQQSFALAELAAVDREVWDAYYDLWCAAKLLHVKELDPRLRGYVEHHLWEALKLVPVQVDDEAACRAAIAMARARIRSAVYDTDRFKGHGRQHLVGHSHLDVVFMWRHAEYLRKVGRTHATMLRLMEHYPEFCFSQSQAKIYADLKRCHPEIYAQVKRRITEGRWEPIGAFWVEPDCNLVSGESFVRQILHGQRFFQAEFGRRSRTCWQPDVFGISWGLAQILARAGIEYVMTAKMIAWNDTNPWTRHTFWWEGMDGSRVLGIIPPGHFIGTVDPDMMDAQWRAFSDRETIGETLHVFGWGDGGGGVDIEMLESAKRYRDFPGLVPTGCITAEAAFDRIKAKALAVPDLPVHRDELYLEAHRGAVTTKGRLKRLNRRAELLFREAEMLAAFAWAAGAPYPSELLDAGWTGVLDAQFHDAVPGTHIPPVYQDLQRDYARVFALGEEVRGAALTRLAGPATPNGAALAVFNSLPGLRDEVLVLPEEGLDDRLLARDGAVLPQQRTVTLAGVPVRLVAGAEVPGCGWRVLDLVPRGGVPAGPTGLTVGDGRLENEHLRVQLNDAGELLSVHDKDLDREMLAAGRRGNVLQLFEDRPGKYDAWDIVASYREHPLPTGGGGRLTVDERGPVRVSLRLERPVAGSILRQRISLAAGDRALVFETEIDWRERQRLLKVAFPVAVNADRATYDIAFGSIERSNRANDPYQAARFEVNAHQWMDLSQQDAGVSLLNDGKYGCDVAADVMRLTLLKAAINPDPQADAEVHHFTYALLPHAGDWRIGRTRHRAACLNQEVTGRIVAAADARRLDHRRLLDPGTEHLGVEAVKRSEDGRDLIVRLVERHNARIRTVLVTPLPVVTAWRCNLMEEPESELPVIAAGIELDIRPCEIVTLRLRL
jgi:alpha-mannosidase